MAVHRTTEQHEHLARELSARQDALISALQDGVDFAVPRQRLVEFLRDEVIEHMQNEETLLYAAARENGLDELAEAMELDHEQQIALIGSIEAASSTLDVARASQAFATLLFLRIAKEERILVPALEKAGVDLDEILGDGPAAPDM